MPSVVDWPEVGCVLRLRLHRPEVRLLALNTPPAICILLALFPLSALKDTLPLNADEPAVCKKPRLALALFMVKVVPDSEPPLTVSRVLLPELIVVAPELLFVPVSTNAPALMVIAPLKLLLADR